MKTIHSLSAVCRLCLALLPVAAAGVSPAGEEPKVESASAVVAEIWPFKAPAGESAKSIFERWRASVPPATAASVPLKGLSLPARGNLSMTRVAGVLVPPVTGRYAFFVEGPGGRGAKPRGETELWIEDAETGAWVLAQRTGNPNERSGRTKLEQGVARRFELWHMGREAVSIKWEIRDWNAAAKKPVVALACQTVPAQAIRQREPGPDQSRDALGPDGPWGDPDGDRLLNWQERLAGADSLNADTAGRAGLVRWELWRGIPGRYVFDLKRAGDYPAGPREVRHLDRLEIPTGNGDAYGSRLRGLIRPPADGEYTFMLIADDTAELWLGEGESSQTKRLIAQANQPPGSARLGWTRTDEKGRVQSLRAEQTARIRLNAGSDYYLEVLHKQDGGQDHCAVAWILPGADKPELIGARHLVSWKPCTIDTDDDGLPDAWQRAAGLLDAKVDSALRHAEADPDGDGATNREEWKAGTAPLDRADTPDTGGMLLSEAWTRIPGRGLAALTGHPRFPTQPDTTTRIDNADFGQEGENYGVRLRGYLTAPANGSYRFSISGNNGCDLYLSPSEDKFAKRLVARVEAGTNWRSFQFGGHFRDGPLKLERGKRYYVEVLFKRGKNDDTRGDHSSVAWRRPGETRFAVIGSEFFSRYRPDPRDLDDDDLPDEWEKLHGLDAADPVGKNGSWGDLDGDGLENFREFQRGLDPTLADVHGTPGLSLWETWGNLKKLPDAHRDGPGLAAALLADLCVPFSPTRREWRDNLETTRFQGVNFGARLRAHIIAPATGDYVFSIAGRDVGELYLSPDDSKFNRRRVATILHGTSFRAWDLRPEQMTKPVRLEAGKVYYIEAIYGRGSFRYDDDFFSVGWKPPGAKAFEVIGRKHLLAFFRDPNDFDDDDLPDDWEKANGLDPADPRGSNSPQGDLDGDGLTNRDEYRSGTRADRADTDGDGFYDADELRIYHTDPCVNNAPSPVLEKSAPLAQWSGVPGSWMAGADGTLVSMQRRGEVSWDIELTSPGVYLIEVVASARGTAAYTPPVPATVLIDGLETQRGTITAGAQPSRIAGLTRWLAAGSHRVTLDNRNVRSGVSVSIVSVNLYRHEGADLDQDGIPDWLENICGNNDQMAENQTESAVSPACVEGVARFTDEVSLAVGKTQVPVLEGLRGRWFANVPLDPASAVELKASFEGGSVTRTTAIKWLATNLMTCPEVLRVRTGDSLLLTAFSADADPQAVNFDIAGGEGLACKGTADQPQPICFEKAGRIVLTASTGTPQGKLHARTVAVEVCAADFGAEFSLAAGYPRAWELPSVARDLHLEADSWLELAEVATTAPAPRTFTATVADPVPARVLARLGKEGPVLAATTINGFRFASATDTGNHHVVRVLADGTRVVEVRYVIDGRVPKDLSVWLHLYVTDALFANGDTWYQLTAADFDENGEARLLIYKAPGTGTPYVCHWIKPFDQESHPGAGGGAEPPPSGQ